MEKNDVFQASIHYGLLNYKWDTPVTLFSCSLLSVIWFESSGHVMWTLVGGESKLITHLASEDVLHYEKKWAHKIRSLQEPPTQNIPCLNV